MNRSRTGLIALLVAVIGVPHPSLGEEVAAAVAAKPGESLAGLATVAACSFVATSVFALTGELLGDHALPPGEIVQVIAIALLWDVVVAPLVLPVLLSLFDRTRPAEMAY